MLSCPIKLSQKGPTEDGQTDLEAAMSTGSISASPGSTIAGKLVFATSRGWTRAWQSTGDGGEHHELHRCITLR